MRGRPRKPVLVAERAHALHLLVSTRLSYRQIAAQVGCGEASVRRWAREEQLRQPAKPLTVDGLEQREAVVKAWLQGDRTIRTICRELGMTTSADYQRACRWVRYETQEAQ
jgi:transposase-like protein